MKKTVSVMLVLILSLSVFASAFCTGAIFGSEDIADKLYSDVYYLESLDEETVFFNKNADKKVPVAGFIKLIAAVVAIEKWNNLDEKIKVTEKNLSLVKYDYGVRTAGYKPGERVSKKDLIDSLIIYSANDAASIIAYEISGSLEGFISEMQTFISAKGCSSTVIKNIHGFDEDGQQTTARDMAAFIKYAVKYPVFSDAFSAKSMIIKAYDDREEKTVTSNNKMMNASISDYYHKSVTGGKYTMTDKAGECVAVVSNMDGYSYLTIVMGGRLMNTDSDSTQENTCFTDAQTMLNWVYDNIRYRVVVSPEQTVTYVDVKAGKDTDKLRLIPERETSALVPSKVTTASVSFEVVADTVPEEVSAPISAGTVIGQAKVFYAGEEITTINLIASQDIERSIAGYIMGKISDIVGSKLFLAISVLLFIACALYLAFMICSYLGIIDEKTAKAITDILNGKDSKKKNTRKPSTAKAPAGKKAAAPAGKKPVKKAQPSQKGKNTAQPVRKKNPNSQRKD